MAWALAALALLPIALLYRLPFTTRPVDVPPWFTTVARTAPADAVVLTYPFASSGLRAPMTWQAVGGLRYSLAGGGSITPDPPAHPTAAQRTLSQATLDLTNLSDGFMPLPTGSTDESHRLRLALQDWGVTTVVIPDESTWPTALRGRSVPVAVATFTAALGTGSAAPGRRLGLGRATTAGATPGRLAGRIRRLHHHGGRHRRPRQFGHLCAGRVPRRPVGLPVMVRPADQGRRPPAH